MMIVSKCYYIIMSDLEITKRLTHTFKPQERDYVKL